jgi:xylulokinase
MELVSHVMKDLYIVHLGSFMAGGLLRWFRDQLGANEIAQARKLQVTPYAVMDREAEEIETGSGGLLLDPPSSPYIVSEYAVPGSLHGLSTLHTRPHLIRAMMEGIGFRLRDCLDVARALDMSVGEVVVTGGCARSRVLNQIKADVLGLPVSRPHIEEPGVLGAAVLAGVGVGEYNDPIGAVKAMSVLKDAFFPQKSTRAKYEEIYESRCAMLAASHEKSRT